MIPGRGACAQIEGKAVLAGNPELLREHGVETAPAQDAEDYIRQGCTVTYVAVDGVFSGFLALSDTLRKESAATIKALSRLGVQPVLLTGDHENAAKTISEKLHIREVRANCLPEDKLKYIGEYQVKAMPHLVALSKRMITTIKLNMTFSMTLNFIAIVLAISGTLNPMVGVLVHNAGSVLVITNSAFLLNWRKKS